MRKIGLEIRIYNNSFAWTFIVLMVLLFASVVSAEEVKPDITAALSAGDTTKAIGLLQQEIATDKAYHYNYYVLGMIYYKQGKCAEAREQFEIALDKKSKHLESLYQLGLCYLKLNDLEMAEKMMTEGRKKAKKNEKYKFENGIGLVFLAQEKYQEADRAFRQAIVGDSAVAEYHINLGDANFYSGVPYLAVSEYEKALALDTAGLEVYFHWAEACLEMRDYNCAMEKLRTVLKKDSTHAEAWNRAGEIFFKAAMSSRSRSERKDRFVEAIGSYNRFVELTGATPDSSNVRTYFELAMSSLNLNGFESAITFFGDVLSIPYEPRDIYFYYGKALWGAARYTECAENLEKHIVWAKEQTEDYHSSVSDAELFQMLGDSWYYREHADDAGKRQDYTQAINFYKKSLEVDAEQTRLLANVAVAYHSLGSYEQALEFYRRRIDQGIDSSSASILKNAGWAALNFANNASGEGEYEEEFEEEGMAAEPVDPNEYYQQAADLLIEYMKYAGLDEKVLLQVANTYLYNLNDCTNGVKYYQELLALQPDNCDAKKSLGYAYFGGVCNKDFTKAIKYLIEADQCVNGSSPCTDPTLVLYIAQAYHLLAAAKVEAKNDAASDFEQAHRWYAKVLKCEPGNAAAKKGQDDTQFEF